MKLVDEICKILGRAVAGSGCKVARHLVAPGSVEGVLADAHELHVSVAHILDVLGQTLCNLTIGVEAILVLLSERVLLPRAHVHLVDGHGLLPEILLLLALGDPGLVGPLELIRLGNARCCARAILGLGGIGVGLVKFAAVWRVNYVLVKLANLGLGHEELENAHVGAGYIFHVMRILGPAVELASDRDCCCMWRPHGEIGAHDTVLLLVVCSHFLVNFVVCSLPEQVHI